MKLAIISDIHSNLQALDRALRTIDSYRVDEIYCLGDIVGYGADPGPCVDLVMRYCRASVMGNHDEAVALDRGIENLPRAGQKAAIHNRNRLSDTQMDYLANLPLRFEDRGCTFVHATPQSPAEWIRIDSLPRVHDQFNYFTTSFCFVGHTHVPAVVCEKLGVFRVRSGHRYIFNTGSIGQPRDQNPKLGFVVFDTETIQHEIIRIEYDIDRAGSRIIEEGLPRQLASRLRKGK